jgi:hypothetical protein
MGIDDLIRMLKASTEGRNSVSTRDDSTPEPELSRVLREAAGGLAAVPTGWSRLQRETESMLQSATGTVGSRGALTVTGVYVLASQPYVRLSAEDPVVHGIYRRVLARARHTCQVCGRVGRTWNDLSQFQVLCTRCAAPHVIAADLDRVEELRDLTRRSDGDAVVVELPVRLANIIAELLDTTKDCSTGEHPGPMSTARTLTAEEFDRWCYWLLALRENPVLVQALASVR